MKWLLKYHWYRRWKGIPANPPCTVTQITNEALRILSSQMAFSESVNRDYVDAFQATKGVTIKVRRPQRFIHSDL